MLDLSILLMAFFFLFYASITDVKTKSIPNSVHAAVIMCGVFRILISSLKLSEAFLGLCSIGILLMLLAVLIQNGNAMGGGDVKLCGALGFLLGIYGAYIMTAIALIASVIYMKLLKKPSVPLAPFITLGYGMILTITFLERTLLYV